jgi:hypothetical protein
MSLAREFAPVPEVFYGGEDWLILSFLEGEQLAESPLSTDAAEALARISSVRFDAAGLKATGTFRQRGTSPPTRTPSV